MRYHIRHYCLRRLIAVVALAAAAPAFANYEACMKFCVAEHSFSHCNLRCDLADGGKKANDNPTGIVPKFDKPCAASYEEQVDLILAFIKEHYGPAFSILSADDEKGPPTSLKLEFYPSYPEEKKCEGQVRVLADCSTITDMDSNNLCNTGLREQTLPCE